MDSPFFTDPPVKPLDPFGPIAVGSCCTTIFRDDRFIVHMPCPLPGIVIFVHGVNSDGEWYEAAEQGLCAGLNTRLLRRNEHMFFADPKGGQLTPARYMDELTPDGYINPDMEPENFLEDDAHFTPVIRFRWGYKAMRRNYRNLATRFILMSMVTGAAGRLPTAVPACPTCGAQDWKTGCFWDFIFNI